MSVHIVISERAEKNLDKIVLYLEHTWSDRVKQNFIKKLAKTMNVIADQPLSFPCSQTKKDVRKCVVTKYTTLYYRVKAKEIEIITIQDSRQNPAF